MIKILQIVIFYVCGQPTTTIIAPSALGGPGQGNPGEVRRLEPTPAGFSLQVQTYRSN